MRILRFFALASMSSALVGAGLAGAPGTGRASVAAQPMAPSNYLAVSTKEVCPLTGHGETQTAARFGLEAADHGYSFRYQGKLWFLFGDAQPTPTFPLSSDVSNENRWSDDPSSLLNDAIAYASPSVPGSCPVLQFIPQTTTAVGAYTDPTVTYDGHLLSLRTKESPVAGIGLTVNSQSRMYVVFNTNNPKATSTPKTCAGRPAGCLGYPYTSVMAVLDDPAKLSFRALYTFSGPPPGPSPYSAPGKFVNVAMALAPDGYVYFWGTTGASEPCAPGLSQCYRHSYVYLARIRATEIAHACCRQDWMRTDRHHSPRTLRRICMLTRSDAG